MWWSGGIDRLDSRLRLAISAGMPTNHTTRLTVLSARISRLAVEAQRAADQLLAESLDYGEAEAVLAAPTLLLSSLVEDLMDTIYRSEKLDERHRLQDLAIAREIASAHRADRLAA